MPGPRICIGPRVPVSSAGASGAQRAQTMLLAVARRGFSLAVDGDFVAGFHPLAPPRPSARPRYSGCFAVSLPLRFLAPLPRAFLIDTSCHSETIVSSTKQTIGDTSNRHKISWSGFLIFNREVGAGRLRPRLANSSGSHYNESIDEVSPRKRNFFPPGAHRWAFVFMGVLGHG